MFVGCLTEINLDIMQGLNPLMFIFAIVANLTYVLRFGCFLTSTSLICARACARTHNSQASPLECSILVRTTEWDRIKANMPWLLDAAACVALDLFVSLRYIFCRILSFSFLALFFSATYCHYFHT